MDRAIEVLRREISRLKVKYKKCDKLDNEQVFMSEKTCIELEIIELKQAIKDLEIYTYKNSCVQNKNQ